MRFLLIVVVLFFIACNETINQGFTNKAEAENKTNIYGQRTGKWIIYLDSSGNETSDTSAPYYNLKIYLSGKPFGILHLYYRNGKLKGEVPYPYTDGKKNGMGKWYYESGKLQQEQPFYNGKANGVEKFYYESGKLREEDLYTDDKLNGAVIAYDENGRIRGERIYSNGKLIDEKPYDSTGKEIK
jgi:antitoxin component YwqK of YwqJK toxin-antitoxin module